EKNIAKYVMSPANAIKKHPVVEQRTKDLTAWAETSAVNKTENNNSKIGIITHSTSYQYVKEIFGDSVNVLKLGMVNPLPVELIKKFAAGCETVVVVEELDPIIENHCKAIGINVHGKDILPICGEFSQNLIVKCFKESGIASLADAVKDYSAETKFKLAENVPVRPPVMCAGCPHRGMFYALSKNKITVLGDIGCYTLGSAAPLNAMEMTLCMGPSVSSLHGFNKALKAESEGKTVAVIGDSTFMHSGMTSLATIAYNQSNSTVIIVDNSITGMTGHQQNPTTGKNLYGDPAGRVNLEALVKSMGINRVRVVDPYNIEQCEQALKEELAANEPSVIISRRPCALLKEVKHPGPISVNPDKCKSCKSCMKIGCPAISMKDGKAKVDDTLCVGCKVCTQMCKFDAFNV
ncbi:MAG: indolepyruvate ferredoxin oxidoreductase subunit alpha, partial [Treponema sp.]|nr:indolepyruvate ferredoxin oxidoreductase subunit alpha [Treponema sp.]